MLENLINPNRRPKTRKTKRVTSRALARSNSLDRITEAAPDPRHGGVGGALAKRADEAEFRASS